MPCCWLHYAGRVNSSVRFHWRDCMHLQGKKRTIPVAASVLVSALLASCGGGGSASSSSAADCVLNNVGSAHTDAAVLAIQRARSEEHTSELQSLMRISSAVF